MDLNVLTTASGLPSFAAKISRFAAILCSLADFSKPLKSFHISELASEGLPPEPEGK